MLGKKNGLRRSGLNGSDGLCGLNGIGENGKMTTAENVPREWFVGRELKGCSNMGSCHILSGEGNSGMIPEVRGKNIGGEGGGEKAGKNGVRRKGLGGLDILFSAEYLLLFSIYFLLHISLNRGVPLLVRSVLFLFSILVCSVY